MQYQQKHELIELLKELKLLMPPVEQRGILTRNFAQAEKRIDEAVKKLQDADYRYMRAAMDKFTHLQLSGLVSFDELIQFTYGTASFPIPKEED